MNTKYNHTSSFVLSISDIRDRYFEDQHLSDDELSALRNFDKFRLEILNGSINPSEFDQRYFQLQVLENLHPYQEFIVYQKISELIK